MANPLKTFWKLHQLPVFMVAVSVGLYYLFAFHLERGQFPAIALTYGLLFFLCFKLIQLEKWNFKFLLTAGLLFRLALVTAIPNLSEDFYRFVWDGSLFISGINPYEFIPSELAQNQLDLLPQGQELLVGMSDLSRKHYSNYPPLNQLLFGLAALLGGKSIVGTTVALRTLLVLADLGIVYFGRKLLKQLNCSPHLIFWYFLNPLVILELTGNLHFEGVMLFFFLWAVYLLHNGKWQQSALVYGLAISTKLVPLIFLPLVLPYLKLKRSLLFYLISATIVGITALPFLTPELFHNYTATLSLWFTNFEFNAGLYNIVAHLGPAFDIKPWHFIGIYGKVTAVLVLLMVLLFTALYRPGNTAKLLTVMLWVLTLYYLLAATVHPWYLIFLVVLCIFTDYRYPLFWSAVVILSYSAYQNPDYQENQYFLAIEYLVVFLVLLYEFFRNRKEISLK